MYFTTLLPPHLSQLFITTMTEHELHSQLPPYPRAISDFINFAPTLSKSGITNSLTLVKRPPANIQEQEGGADILAGWNEWWSLT